MIGNHLVLACSINLIEGCDTRVTAKRPVVYSALSEPCQARQSQRISAGLSAGVPNHAPKPRTQATHPNHAPKPRTQTTHPNHAPKPRTQATHLQSCQRRLALRSLGRRSLCRCGFMSQFFSRDGTCAQATTSRSPHVSHSTATTWTATTSHTTSHITSRSS
jgi:hypothetical protein